MPATSQAQAVAMRIALAAKEGRIPTSNLKGASLQMYKSMSVKQLRDFAHTKNKGLPKHQLKHGMK